MLTSSAFKEGEPIPQEYSCRGAGINPPLQISGVPAATRSLALLVDDPDAPGGDWVHWVLWNIDPKTAEIKADSVPAGSQVGKSGSGANKYEGPCPPSGTHHYKFKLYALDKTFDLPPASGKTEFLAAISGHVVDLTILTGLFQR